MISLFLDANVYFAASRSQSGGSAKLCRIIQTKRLKIYASSLVLLEAEKNIRLKEPLSTRLNFYKLVADLKPKIVKINSRKAEENFIKIINRKDTHVLEGAKLAEVSFLVTLDKKDFFSQKINQAKLPFVILTPGELIHKLEGKLLADSS